MVFFWFLCFIIGFEWSIKAWGIFQYCFWHFWNFQYFSQIWTPGPLDPLFLNRILWKHTREIENHFKNMFVYLNIMENNNFQFVGRCGTPFFNFSKHQHCLLGCFWGGEIDSDNECCLRFFPKTCSKPMIFQVRESAAPLNILVPTPTPAPDHPLGGHEWASRISEWAPRRNIAPCDCHQAWLTVY